MMFGGVTKKDRYSALSSGLQGSEIKRRTEFLLKSRERSSSELRDRLLQLGFSGEVVEAEIERVTRCGIVDDERFLRLFVSGKKRSGWGQMRIERELRHFGIDIRAHEDYPDAFFNADEELERALTSACGFRTSAKDKYSACYRKLVSKGYAPEIVARVVPQAIAMNENNNS